jgi:hypothetical protein
MFLLNHVVCDIGKDMIGEVGIRTSTITPPSSVPMTLADLRVKTEHTFKRIEKYAPDIKKVSTRMW